MVDLRAFAPDHADEIALQDAQVAEMAAAGEWRAHVRRAGDYGPAWSAFLGERLIGCGGFVAQWRGRATSWCLLGRDIPRPAWVALHRAVRQRIEQAPVLGWWRVEAHVAAGFGPGVRWVELLGMEREGLAAGYLPDGGDAWLYARVFR